MLVYDGHRGGKSSIVALPRQEQRDQGVLGLACGPWLQSHVLHVVFGNAVNQQRERIDSGFLG